MYKMFANRLKNVTLALALCFLLTGCDRKEAKAQAAFAEYQAAASSGDLAAARDALLRLTAIDEDVADYWAELGRVQLALGAYPDAYFALTRALELNRSSPDLLRILAQLSLRADRLDLAEDYAEQLDLVAPGDVAVRLTKAMVALRQNNLEEASAQSAEILKADPTNSDARLIESQVLQRSGKPAEAIALLEKQVALKSEDIPAHRALAALYEEADNLKKSAEHRRRVYALRPDAAEEGVRAVEASFRAGDVEWAQEASIKLLGPKVPAAQVRAVLTLWEDEWSGAERVRLARRLAQAAPVPQKAEFAQFLIRTGAPSDAASILAPIVGTTADRRNVQHAGIYAHALVDMGKVAEARRWIDEVLAIDQDNVDALRATVRLDVRRKDFEIAINDAQKIVTLVPDSAEDRLLLSRTYAAAGDRREAERVLWQAFHDLPGDRHVYVALQQFLIASGDIDGRKRVASEFAERRRASNLKDLI